MSTMTYGNEVYSCVERTNARGNPAAAIDVDVNYDGIGGLGSPLGSSAVSRQLLYERK